MDTRPLRMLSGAEIVDRGRNVTDCILPEVGTKEVTPNGSWLETKQVQTALEARKALIAAERIDKVGALSHAEWRDELKLAEVTQQVGGYWQYLGHNVNGTLYLLPEEALYLIETNCLLLKHNHVTVSLQKAYSLLLLDSYVTLTQYKVYASLSRVGYKVFRHNKLKLTSLRKSNKKGNATIDRNASENMSVSANVDLGQPAEEIVTQNETNSDQHNGNSTNNNHTMATEQPGGANNNQSKMSSDTQLAVYRRSNSSNKKSEISSDKQSTVDYNYSSMDLMSVDMAVPTNDTSNKEESTVPKPRLQRDVANSNGTINENPTVGARSVLTDPKVIPSIDVYGVIRLVSEELPADVDMETITSSATSDSHTTKTDESKSTPNKPRHMLNIYQVMQQKIKNRKTPNSDPKGMQERFKDIPDCFNKQILTVNVPSEDYLPRNIFLNNTSYVLNLKNLKSNYRRKSTSPTVENRAMYRTIRNSSESETAAVPTPEHPQFLPSMPMYQQPFGYFPTWRPRFQQFIQRPRYPRYHFNEHPYFYRMMHFTPQNFYRPYMNYRNQWNRRKRPHNRHKAKDAHLQAIKNFANRLKNFPMPPNNSLNSLIGLLARFNEIYNERIRITPHFEVINDNHNNVETINLDDDEVESIVESKKPRLDSAKFDNYLASVKALAAKLKNLERKNQSVAKHKRAFSNLLKNFNEAFNAEFHLDSKGTLIDKKLVVLDSSSDSDVVATDDIETSNEKKRTSNCDNSESSKNKKRKLINPLCILKKVNEGAGTSKSSIENRVPDIPVESDSKDLQKYFTKNWLPNDEDFGKPTLCSKTDALYLWSESQQLYDFISWVGLNNWTDLKLSFCSHMEAVSDFELDLNTHSRDLTTESSRLKPILHEASDDWPSSLEKLRIIKSDTEVQETDLRIDFDVYNRDVQNFRKTDPPKAHFRVVCVDESSRFPSGAEVRAIHGKHDGVTTVFAVVGVGSVTYLQINPKDLPVYVGND